MAVLHFFIFVSLGGLALVVLLVHAQDQSDFISIDCGLPANSTYTENTTSIIYISDDTFIDTGIRNSIPLYLKDAFQRQVWSLRSFPQGTRNCYHINITASTRYLIRATFLHGGYDGGSHGPDFDLYLGASKWDTVKIKNVSISLMMELIHVPSQNYIHVCLVNTGLGTPFISAIELRPLKNNTYVTTLGSLSLFFRGDVGSVSDDLSYRYPYDVHDRAWLPYNFYQWTELTTSLTIDSQSSNDYQPAVVVMGTAATPINDTAPIQFSWDSDSTTSEYYIYMHFAEVVNLEANQSRSFNVSVNNKFWYGPLAPNYLYTNTLYSKGALKGENRYEFSIFKTENSTLPPILNAMEIYSVKYFTQPETEQEDVVVDAITKIQSTYGIKRDWQGDPCAPEAYSWEGLNCTYDTNVPPRIISLNLSSSGLTGEISADIANLAMLQYLDLSNNSLTGQVPDFLSQLQYLTVLNLERNQLTGTVPPELIARSKNGSLSLSSIKQNVASVDENPNLDGCVNSCKKKNTSPVVPIVASVGGLFVLSLIVAAILLELRRRRNINRDKPGVAMVYTESHTSNIPSTGSFESLQRQFSYSDLLKITNNFERILGKGGFGTVYHGYTDQNTQVAVKVLSPSSGQGYRQFQSEARCQILNLTTLVGYCYEGTNMGLVYEYMANGDLEAHLSDDNVYVLSWEDRLRIATDAAQGLEYLHHGCKPPIIHRDVKCTNILLNEKFQAKLADFGLSKMFPTDGITHVSTVVAGTPGYLDPEYYTTNWLNEKSDVYSFGVVLLEIITCRPVIELSPERTHITQWASSMLATGDIKNMVDPRLRGNFNVNSAWKAIEIAMACVSQASTERPTMSQVAGELKECLETELAGARKGHEGASVDSIDMINMNLATELNPLAR
ncbi:hypothetical protein CJ030_MR3G026347 [Morella rubra]|uniref:non-specific serine/threonine protein kinase n=1 Tax=Morella rubra TaxID=262757 RepID=A0A6A1W2X0_9ROSI|nr:hypothetical protein CJ030_MR3G026347 [Morella rubra]